MRVKFPLVLAAAGLVSALIIGGRVIADDQKAEAKVKCPVKGIEFTPNAKTKSVMVNGEKISFCCGGCPAAFAAEPEKYIANAGECPVQKGHPATVSAKGRVVVNNDLYYFCCAGCPGAFKASPGKFVTELSDPVSGAKFAPKAESPRSEVNGQVYLFASSESKATFDKDSGKYVTAYK